MDYLKLLLEKESWKVNYEFSILCHYGWFSVLSHLQSNKQTYEWVRVLDQWAVVKWQLQEQAAVQSLPQQTAGAYVPLNNSNIKQSIAKEFTFLHPLTTALNRIEIVESLNTKWRNV